MAGVSTEAALDDEEAADALAAASAAPVVEPASTLDPVEGLAVVEIVTVAFEAEEPEPAPLHEMSAHSEGSDLDVALPG